MVLKRKTVLYLCVLICLQMVACKPIQKVPHANLEYFKSESDSLVYPTFIGVQQPPTSVIQKDDILAIIARSANLESNDVINYMSINTLPVSVFSGNVGGGVQPLGYAVDSLGFINIPTIGKIQLEGETLQRAEEIIRAELVKKVKNPIVNIRYMNRKFSILGEVNNVGTYNLLDDKTTILDAIALAGDITIFGKRDSIMIIRNAYKKREIGIVNLTNRTVFTSQYFYLRNGDIIYVEPVKNKVLPEIPYKPQPPQPTILQRLPVVLSATSLIVLIINLFK